MGRVPLMLPGLGDAASPRPRRRPPRRLAVAMTQVRVAHAGGESGASLPPPMMTTTTGAGAGRRRGCYPRRRRQGGGRTGREGAGNRRPPPLPHPPLPPLPPPLLLPPLAPPRDLLLEWGARWRRDAARVMIWWTPCEKISHEELEAPPHLPLPLPLPLPRRKHTRRLPPAGRPTYAPRPMKSPPTRSMQSTYVLV